MEVLLDSVPAFIWYKDCENRILRANRLAAESMGLSVDQLEGRSAYDLYPDEASKYHRDDLEVIRSGTPKLGIVELLTTASGEKRWVLRLRTVEGMAAQLAHEINQPLAAVVNFARGLARRLSCPELDVASAQRVIDQISREAVRAAEVVQRLRAFLRKDAPRRELCDARDVVREAASLIDDEARRAGVALHLDLDPHDARVEIDAIQVEQVVLNLLRNALEAMDERSPGPHSIVVQTVTTSNGGVEVRVRDNGPGLPVDDVQQLFEAFFTTKEKSLGMGLSISQKIVEAQGGALWGAANREGGATFSFTLPPAHTPRGCGSP